MNRIKPQRFMGLTETEIKSKTLPDHLAKDLDIVIIGINPGLTAAFKGHHYAGPGNHFWKCLYESKLIPKPLTAYDDYKLIEYGIGFTNIVSRTTRGSNELTKSEIKKGADILRRKLQTYHPKIAVFNGKGIYEVFSGTNRFDLGLQTDTIEGTDTKVFVMPSSSARCSHLPRASDKLPYYEGLRKLRDHLKGHSDSFDPKECVFPQLKSPVKRKRVDCEIPTIGGVTESVGSDVNEIKLLKDKTLKFKALMHGTCLKQSSEFPNKKKIPDSTSTSTSTSSSSPYFDQ